MEENYVTTEQLEQKLKTLKGNPIGRAVNGVVSLASSLAGTAISLGAIAYLAMSCAYGPYDAGKVVYSQLSGDRSVMKRSVEEAKWLFARKIQKQELDDRDMKNFYLEMGVVGSEDKKPTEEDISWYRMLDWIEDNN